MAEQNKKTKPASKSRRKAKKEPEKRYNKELQFVLDLLPYGPIQLQSSKTTLQSLLHSVQSEGYPLLSPIPKIRLERVHCRKWQTQNYDLTKRITLEHSTVLLTYTYDIVCPGKKICMPMSTKAKIEVITLKVGQDIVFSTHDTLTRQGRKGIERLSERYELSYSLYTDQFVVHTGTHTTEYYMDYTQGCLKRRVY